MIVKVKTRAKPMERLTREQRAAVDGIREWYADGPEQITLGGLAGTGKTTLAQRLPRELGVDLDRVAYCAYTGKAARVLSRRLTGSEATTIHRLICKPIEVHCDNCPTWRGAKCHGNCPICGVTFARVDRIDDRDLIIVDEASMVTADIYRDLTSYGIPIVWIGDHGQLPPVGGSFNLMERPQLRLETIHRQVASSPIIRLAMEVRRTGIVPYGEHGPGVLKRRGDGTIDVGGENLDAWDGLLIMAGRNKTRVQVNRAVRAERGFPADRPVAGDRVICLRNDYDAGVVNGDTGTIREIRDDLVTIDVDEHDETYVHAVALEQFNTPKTLTDITRRLGLWDYGYCLTVHKAQGSEADRVILIEERLGADPNSHKRWLYTGITRAKRALEIIK